MPKRIYALAKELQIDSKELVDVCDKVGVTGKGSALASLNDDEIVKVKAYLAGGTKTTAAPPPKTQTLQSAGATVSAPTVPFTREDYIAPTGVSGKPKVISARTQQDVEEKKPADEGALLKPPTKKEPVVKLAAIPDAPPAPEAQSDEPAAQKPIMTLPADAIRGAKEGSTAPLEQFTKHQDKKKKPAGHQKKGAMPPVAGGDAVTAKQRPGRDGRRGRDSHGAVEEKGGEGKGLAGMANARAARQQNRKRRSSKNSFSADDDGTGTSRPRRQRTRLVRKGTNTAAPRKGLVSIELPCTVRSFSEATGVASSDIQRALMGLGNMLPINAQLEPELAELLAAELGLELAFKQRESLEESLLTKLAGGEDDPSKLKPRPPVVTFLGHVDHGKTSLLDKVLGIDVVSGEAGGITQHIRAYEVDKDGRKIAFVDTPGHEAFTEMRARGANVTDIAVLVVAADDGVMPQTEEAISHAKAAEVPIVVALNKMDLPGADVNRALQDLSTQELLPTEWGGDIEVVKTSAITGDGVDDLLETLLLTAELHEYKANPDRPAVGTCLEAQQEGGRGVVAKMIVQNGTLRVGDIMLCGAAFGRIKAMYDPLHPHRRLTEAGPSTPVNLTGLDTAPEAGEAFYVVEDIADARDIAEQRSHVSREQSLSAATTRVSFEEFQRRLSSGDLSGEGEVKYLNLILRADVRGSIEAIRNELEKLRHPEVQVRVLQSTVGAVSVADVTLADASDAVIIGFNVIPDEAARALADERGVEIRRYDIIYKVTEDIRALLEGKLEPEERTADLGRALVQRLFTISRLGTIAGCRVLAGTIERGCRVRVNRDGRGIGDYPLESLRREKDDAKEVREGFECGMKLAGFNDLKEGDVLEAYKIEEVARTL